VSRDYIAVQITLYSVDQEDVDAITKQIEESGHLYDLYHVPS
jgi:ribosomal protein S10